MQKMQMFESPEFGQVRTLTENGEVLFCGLDVAKALGYVKPSNAIIRHCRGGTETGCPHKQWRTNNDIYSRAGFVPTHFWL